MIELHLLQAPAPPEGMQNNLASLYSQNTAQRPAKKNFRNIPQAPERILDAPELLDDYYLNLLDWGPMNNVVIGGSDHLLNNKLGCMLYEMAELLLCVGSCCAWCNCLSLECQYWGH